MDNEMQGSTEKTDLKTEKKISKEIKIWKKYQNDINRRKEYKEPNFRKTLKEEIGVRQGLFKN